MQNDPFADALAEDIETDLESNATLTLGGVQPSPDEDKKDFVGDVDDDDESTPAADVGRSTPMSAVVPRTDGRCGRRCGC